jgi:hypothetical protein
VPSTKIGRKATSIPSRTFNFFIICGLLVYLLAARYVSLNLGELLFTG